MTQKNMYAHQKEKLLALVRSHSEAQYLEGASKYKRNLTKVHECGKP